MKQEAVTFSVKVLRRDKEHSMAQGALLQWEKDSQNNLTKQELLHSPAFGIIKRFEQHLYGRKTSTTFAADIGKLGVTCQRTPNPQPYYQHQRSRRSGSTIKGWAKWSATISSEESGAIAAVKQNAQAQKGAVTPNRGSWDVSKHTSDCTSEKWCWCLESGSVCSLVLHACPP